MAGSVPPRSSYRPAASPELREHQKWIGFVQPTGLIVSIPALERAQCYASKQVTRERRALEALMSPKNKDGTPAPGSLVPDLRPFVRDVLGWEASDLAAPPLDLGVALPEYGETLKPSFVVPSADGTGSFQILVSVVGPDQAFDDPERAAGWPATPQVRLERLLRDSRVPIGILWNGRALRLVYAPSGESSGFATFPVEAMCQATGQPILSAMVMLLGAERLFSLPEAQRLPAILRDSRRYQNEVSTRLAEQVLAALHELLRGVSAANDASRGELLGEVLREDASHIYGGLLTTLLRLVFVLYAEDRGLLPTDSVYAQSYSVGGLFEKLREDASRYSDTMDQRFGAWARLLVLFRLIHDGATHGALRLPARHGRLFNPDAYPFLEGRRYRAARQVGERAPIPRISDGVVLSVLDNLLVLDGDRLSYRALDVEQIGSVYEAMMGFAVEVAAEPSLALRAKRKPGAPPADPFVGLDTLLAKKGTDRIAALDELGVDVSGKPATAVKEARSRDELVAALAKKISPLSPEVVPTGGLVLQPTEERRRSGSHYTPRALTEPIVDTTLRPLLEALGPIPSADAILSLKICDPAMGSGAFLVAACRALGDRLVAAWQREGMPALPPDEDAILHARRVVAQRCLYGVDKNPFAVDLAKLSLWLVTLARNHPFTFLDHALRQGDSLVGLSREQIASFHWAPKRQVPMLRQVVDAAVAKALELRARIHALGDSDDTAQKQALLDEAEAELSKIRRVGDLVIDAFFSGKNAKEREARLGEYRSHIERHGLDGLPDAPEAERVTPFHWEIEYPEVFARSAVAATLPAHNEVGP